MLDYFEHVHLTLNNDQRFVAEQFRQLAHVLAGYSARSSEIQVALRKLVETKDAALRGLR